MHFYSMIYNPSLIHLNKKSNYSFSYRNYLKKLLRLIELFHFDYEVLNMIYVRQRNDKVLIIKGRFENAIMGRLR